jgi:hypothetical protein
MLVITWVTRLTIGNPRGSQLKKYPYTQILSWLTLEETLQKFDQRYNADDLRIVEPIIFCINDVLNPRGETGTQEPDQDRGVKSLARN